MLRKLLLTRNLIGSKGMARLHECEQLASWRHPAVIFVRVEVRVTQLPSCAMQRTLDRDPDTDACLRRTGHALFVCVWPTGQEIVETRALVPLADL